MINYSQEILSWNGYTQGNTYYVIFIKISKPISEGILTISTNQ